MRGILQEYFKKVILTGIGGVCLLHVPTKLSNGSSCSETFFHYLGMFKCKSCNIQLGHSVFV